MSIPPYSGSASGSFYASSSSSQSASPSGAGASDETDSSDAADRSSLASLSRQSSFLSASPHGAAPHDAPDREAAGGSPAPLSGRASPFEDIQHPAEDTAALVQCLVDDGLAQLADALARNMSMQPTRPEHVQELAFRLIESLTTCFQSKSAAELRSLIELERAIDTQGILRKRAPLRLYVQSCRSHLAEEWHEVINGWHPIGPPAFLGGLNERLNEWSIVERVTAAITESGRRMALDLAHPGLADPLDAGSLINISASARSVLTTYSDSLDDLMGVLASPGDSVLAEEGGPIVFTWIPLNNPNRDAIRLAFEVHAIPLLRGRTERDLELILASERSSLYLEWIRAKRSVTELLASYH